MVETVEVYLLQRLISDALEVSLDYLAGDAKKTALDNK